MDRDELALELYGTLYDNLSRWGQIEIDKALSYDSPKEIEKTTYESTASLVILRRELTETKRKLAITLDEYQELWEENEELKMQLAAQERENAHRDGGNTRDGEEQPASTGYRLP